jgi:WD40 repeat protein
VEGERGKSFARVWDSGNGRLLYQSDVGVALTTYEVPISPDSKYIAVISSDNDVRIIKTGSWETIATLGMPSHQPRLATFSPDGRYLATGGYDRAIRIGTRLVGELVRGHTWRLEKEVCATMEECWLHREDGTARAWEVGTWRLLAVLQGGHTRPLYDLAVSPEGRYVVTTATDSLARVWDLGASVQEFTEIDGASHNGVPEQVPTVYSPNGTLLATRGEDGVEVWETATRRNVVKLGRGNFLGFSEMGNMHSQPEVS